LLVLEACPPPFVLAGDAGDRLVVVPVPVPVLNLDVRIAEASGAVVVALGFLLAVLA
jgi:hypothetical protein